MEGLDFVQPPADVPEILRGDWLDLPPDDAVVGYLTEALWAKEGGTPEGWEVARLSQAAYLYREKSTGWTVVGKFYVVKGGDAAGRHAQRELNCIREAQAIGLTSGPLRAIRPLALWRGVLFLEYVNGLTLEDVIAVRHSRPGRLSAGLTGAARFLAALHSRGLRPETAPDFEAALAYARKVVAQLAKYGVLQARPLVRDGLFRLIDRWADRVEMAAFTPTLIHGDVTTTNFIFVDDEVVVIDWERLEVADPAADLGRLMAEVGHSIQQHGGTTVEALPFVECLAERYRMALPEAWDAGALVRRARFYRATSTLRIARNGWISRLDRTALVAQAMALLADFE
ncbi:MAG: phosphotransferase family protein [Anaerolineae bacterium]